MSRSPNRPRLLAKDADRGLIEFDPNFLLENLESTANPVEITNDSI